MLLSRSKLKIFFLFWLLPIAALFAADGIQYNHLEIPNSSYFSYITGPQSIHVIEVDPSLYEIKPVKALDNGLGRESVLSLSERHSAIASVNGGFFSIGGLFDGRACGTLKIHDWYALPTKPRGCIGWSVSDLRPRFDRLLVTASMQYGHQTILLSGLNRVRKEAEAILFTPAFHRTTLTLPDGEEITVIDGIIQKIVKGGSSKIPENGYVVSIQKEHPLFGTFTEGMELAISINTDSLTDTTPAAEWDQLDYIVGGTPLLLYHSSRIIDFSSEQTLNTFLTYRHVRTAIGVLPNGNWVFVVVDKTTLFDGMTMNELTGLMAKLGCVHALNLDVGGSSTMVYEGSIINHLIEYGDGDSVHDHEVPRRVSDAIVIVPKRF
ncbi:MAG: phosphodiester glycosidase family protein [Chlamydiae bacterium]|nr:phosphodiester glycosidase family protein [Chlamydiota bacterium]